jgi:hypothetical protein
MDNDGDDNNDGDDEDNNDGDNDGAYVILSSLATLSITHYLS